MQEKIKVGIVGGTGYTGWNCCAFWCVIQP